VAAGESVGELLPTELRSAFLNAVAGFGALSAGGSGSGVPTKTIAFRGPYNAGSIESVKIDQDMDLVFVISNVAAYALITLGRTAASFGPGWHAGGACVALIQGASGFWMGRQRYKAGDFLYIDSLGNLGTNDFITFTFEPLAGEAGST